MCGIILGSERRGRQIIEYKSKNLLCLKNEGV